MKLIKPEYQILSPKILTIKTANEILQDIELAGRTCYKSEDKITETSAVEFVRMLVKRGHESVLEHRSISVKFTVDRGVSHELVRHRLASFSQESTRYCNYSKDKFDKQLTFIIPPWCKNIKPKIFPIGIPIDTLTNLEDDEMIWLSTMKSLETKYNGLLDIGWTPQEARSILPNSLKTEIVVTANLREWRTIFKQRISKHAHPQMREVMQPLFKKLMKPKEYIIKITYFYEKTS